MSEAPWNETLLHMWQNGGRPMLIAAIALMASVVFLSAIYLALQFKSTTEEMPIVYHFPQELVGENMIQRGTVFQVRRTRCNSSTRPETLIGSSYYHRLDSTKVPRVPYSQGEAVVAGKSNDNPDGCETTRLSNTLPADVEPGVWRLEGQTCLKRNPQLCASWATEQFTVVP